MRQHVGFHPENHDFDQTDVPIRAQGTIRQGITIEMMWGSARMPFFWMEQLWVMAPSLAQARLYAATYLLIQLR
jgi:hypothetical protein